MFDRQIEQSVEIVARPSEVWWQLTNFDSYPDWNPLYKRVKGELREGARLAVTVDPNGVPAMIVRPRIIIAEPERELRWRGRIALPHAFTAEHAFIIKSVGVDRVRFTQRERFEGLLVPGALLLIESALGRGFREMNDALKQRAEAAHASREVAEDENTERPI